jgi:hypothetical protein
MYQEHTAIRAAGKRVGGRESKQASKQAKLKLTSYSHPITCVPLTQIFSTNITSIKQKFLKNLHYDLHTCNQVQTGTNQQLLFLYFT